VMISGLRRLSQALRHAGVTALFLNQTRGRGESAHTGEEASAGGPGLKLYAAVRIALEPAGRGVVRFRILKNKSGEPFAGGQLHWESGTGFTEGP
jgi:RecA/RadA recombinase